MAKMGNRKYRCKVLLILCLLTSFGSSCRSCNTLSDFKFATSKIKSPNNTQQNVMNEISRNEHITFNDKIPGSGTYKKIEPPDVEQLGSSSWTLLHSIAAAYPQNPNNIQKSEMTHFLTMFSHIYPCWWCAKDFEKFIKDNAPKVESQNELGNWMCDAHNTVNRKLGKEEFNCKFWKNRWKDGWE